MLAVVAERVSRFIDGSWGLAPVGGRPVSPIRTSGRRDDKVTSSRTPATPGISDGCGAKLELILGVAVLAGFVVESADRLR